MLPPKNSEHLSAFMTHDENIFNSLIKKNLDAVPELIKQ
jgi:hypothetical protein